MEEPKIKATKNTAEKTEKKSRAELERELGRLTYEIAKLKAELNKKAQRSNEIANLLDKMDG